MKRLWLLLILLSLPVYGQQTIFFRDTGVTCDPPTDDAEDMSATAGASDVNEAILTAVSGGNLWTFEENARTIQSGTWTVTMDITVGSGGGPQNRVDVTVDRYTDGCAFQENICTVADNDVNKGVTCETVTAQCTGVSAITFAETDKIFVSVTDSNGNQTKTMCYNNSSGGDHDSRLTYPDESTARHPIIITELKFDPAPALISPSTGGRNIEHIATGNGEAGAVSCGADRIGNVYGEAQRGSR